MTDTIILFISKKLRKFSTTLFIKIYHDFDQKNELLISLFCDCWTHNFIIYEKDRNNYTYSFRAQKDFQTNLWLKINGLPMIVHVLNRAKESQGRRRTCCNTR